MMQSWGLIKYTLTDKLYFIIILLQETTYDILRIIKQFQELRLFMANERWIHSSLQKFSCCTSHLSNSWKTGCIMSYCVYLNSHKSFFVPFKTSQYFIWQWNSHKKITMDLFCKILNRLQNALNTHTPKKP